MLIISKRFFYSYHNRLIFSKQASVVANRTASRKNQRAKGVANVFGWLLWMVHNKKSACQKTAHFLWRCIQCKARLASLVSHFYRETRYQDELQFSEKMTPISQRVCAWECVTFHRSMAKPQAHCVKRALEIDQHFEFEGTVPQWIATLLHLSNSRAHWKTHQKPRVTQ